MTTDERRASLQWREFLNNIKKLTHVEKLSEFEIKSKRIELEKDVLKWIKYFFPHYCKYPFAQFHKDAIDRLTSNEEWYEVLSWSRELAKSTTVMMVVLYLALTKQRRNIILVSNSLDNAKRLLSPLKIDLESNARILSFYGKQRNLGSWTDGEFVTTDGVSFRALGAGQSPRGTRNESTRPDLIWIDDIDTDQDCRNPDIINSKWNWIQEALYFSRSISEPLLTIFCGNIISRDCCITRAGAMADNWDIKNLKMVDINNPNPILDYEHGVSVWPEKNNERVIMRVLSKVSASAAQKECFNNPITEGEVFKNLLWGEVPSLDKFKCLVAYGDPAPGENRGKGSSSKTCILCGIYDEKLYIIKAYVKDRLNEDFIKRYYEFHNYVSSQTPLYHYIENNTLQDPFYQQIFRPLISKINREQNLSLFVNEDKSKKSDKATRIEADLQPLDRDGKLIFNQLERDSEDMKSLIEQFRLFTLRLKFAADGPDAVQGAYRILLSKNNSSQPIKRISHTSIIKAKNTKRL